MSDLDGRGRSGRRATASGVVSVLSVTPAERLAEARAAWQGALVGDDETALADAASLLQRAQAWEEAADAYALLGQLHPHTVAAAARGAGDCWLYRVYANAGEAREHRVRALETALGWYDRALGAGCGADVLDASYWSACELLIEACEGHRARQVRLIERYVVAFPAGAHRQEADGRLAQLQLRG